MSTTTFKHRLAIPLLALAVVAAACGSGSGNDPEGAVSIPAPESAEALEATGQSDQGSPTAEPTASVTATPEPSNELPDPSFQKELREVAQYEFGHEFGLIEAQHEQYAPLLLEPATYTTESMDTPMTFTIDAQWRLISELTANMILVDHEAANALVGLPLVQFDRPGVIVDSSTASKGPPEWEPGEGWDFDEWFAAQPGLDVIRTEFDVGGIPSVRYDISYGEGSESGFQCGPDFRCTPIVFLHRTGPHMLQSNELIHFWVIPQGEHEPLTATVVADVADGWQGFDEKVEQLMASIEFGETKPVSISRPVWEAGFPSDVPEGSVWLPILGGLRFDLDAERLILQRLGWSWIEFDEIETSTFPTNIEIAAAAETIDDVAIESADQLAELLVEQGGGTRLDDAELLGRPAAVVDMRGVVPAVPLFRHVDVAPGTSPRVAVWQTLDYVEVWAVDTPNGVLILTGEADSPESLDEVMEIHAQLRETLVLDPR